MRRPVGGRKTGTLSASGLILSALIGAASCNLAFSYRSQKAQSDGGVDAADPRSDADADSISDAAGEVELDPSPYSCIEHAACLLTCNESTECATACGELRWNTAPPSQYLALAACYEDQRCADRCGTFKDCVACLTSACAGLLYDCFREGEQNSPLSCPELWECALRCQYSETCDYLPECYSKGSPDAQSGVLPITSGGCQAYLTCFEFCPPDGFFYSCYLECNTVGNNEIMPCTAAMEACFKRYM